MSESTNVAAELGIIGSLFAEPKRAVPLLISRLESERFSNHLLGDAYRIGLEMYAKTGAVDFVPHLHHLEQKYSDEDCKVLMAQSIQTFSDISNLPHYIRAVNDCYKQRRLSGICAEYAFVDYDPSTVNERLEDVGAKIAELINENENRGLVRVSDIVVEQYTKLFDRQSTAGNLRTGYSRLDEILRGIRKKQLVVVGARPGIGKSAFVSTNWALSFARMGKHVALYSLEMSRDELFERFVANISGVNLGVISDRDLGERSGPKVAQAADELAKLPISLYDYGNLTTQQIRTEAKLKGVDVIILDYLQLLTPVGKSDSRNRVGEITQMTRELKLISKDLEIPVIALSQLSRLSSPAEEPQLSHLRDSGSIEQDADIVIFLWQNGEDEREIACKVSKNRGGKRGEVVFRFNGGLMRFEETGLVVNRKKTRNVPKWDEDAGDLGVF